VELPLRPLTKTARICRSHKKAQEGSKPR
jgi:hypothetical protein